MTNFSSINSRQRAYLRSLAHHIKPVMIIGKEGITDAVIQSISDALNRRELLKIKVLESAPVTASESGKLVAARIDGAHSIQTIGRIVVIYRPYAETPEIQLPK